MLSKKNFRMLEKKCLLTKSRFVYCLTWKFLVLYHSEAHFLPKAHSIYTVHYKKEQEMVFKVRSSCFLANSERIWLHCASALGKMNGILWTLLWNARELSEAASWLATEASKIGWYLLHSALMTGHYKLIQN